MAHLSQVGPSHCIHSENIRSKVGYSLVFNIGSVQEYRTNEDTGQLSMQAPLEDAVIATEPLTKEDLVAYLASRCKPKEKWRIGTEREKFGFESETLRPMKLHITIMQGKQIISLEPRGQFELSVIPEDQDVVDANNIEMNGEDDSDHEINASNLPRGYERDHGDEFSIGGNDLDYEFGGSNTISGLRETEMSRFNDKNAFKEREAHKAIAKLFCCAALPPQTVEEFYYVKKFYNYLNPKFRISIDDLKDALELESGGEFSSQDVRDNYEVPSAEEWEKVRSICELVDSIYELHYSYQQPMIDFCLDGIGNQVDGAIGRDRDHM
ncbi:hypothetical protein LOK49_LG08G03401 [Camellia lanceoleosa]|uniref:Uncharacterized protein n=1 Tax=Camellia lanceoleosa TaxID=1840588 RepID=A0ACC0GXQ1_9ERIC|nr:hypothetical protein LOK49_LG08G03401 [Camellia lanceoleosa]